MNQSFREPVVATAAGGVRGGGTALTGFGREVVRRYRRIEASAQRAGKRDLDALLTAIR
jgi:molybdate transport system regulatory protein